MNVEICCPACEHAHVLATDAPVALEDIGVFVCDACSTRVVFGKVLPRVVVEPYEDERGHRWIRRRFQDPVTKADIYVIDADPIFAVAELKSVLSLVQT